MRIRCIPYACAAKAEETHVFFILFLIPPGSITANLENLTSALFVHPPLMLSFLVFLFPDRVSILLGVLIMISAKFLVLNKKTDRLPLPPGPFRWPILGNIFDMPRALEWITFTEWKKTYGKSRSLPHSHSQTHPHGLFLHRQHHSPVCIRPPYHCAQLCQYRARSPGKAIRHLL